ncbi:MAG TPA: hypothetical protein ENK08_06815 [Chloroflexi bacterium]|nr:hypothetical protein [Chloroflexota bacterium]
MKEIREVSGELLEALQIAKEAEQKAEASYVDAAAKAGNSLGRMLFEQLAEFERYHYRWLVALEESLREKGAFVEYEPREWASSPPGEVKGLDEPNRMSLVEIVQAAMEFEWDAEKRYVALSKEVTDPLGKAMFERLAAEERKHYQVLENAFWSLNNHGVWVWPA